MKTWSRSCWPGGAEKQVAIAQRPTLGEGLTESHRALRDPSRRSRPATLNEGAAFSDDAFAGVLKRFSNDNEIKSALVSRSTLPMHVTEKLLNLVSGELFDRLVNTHELPPQLAIEIAAGARERATLDLVEQAGLTTDPERFVQQLLRRLTDGRLAVGHHAERCALAT